MSEHAWFYNLRVGRSQQRVNIELRALAESGPLVVGLCEALGYHLPELPGYHLVRDRSTDGRANIAAYVRKGPRLFWSWVDLRETWGRTQHPGEHWPRSILRMRVGGAQVVVAHAPPKYTNNTIPAQSEHAAALSRIMGPWLRDGWDDRTWTDKRRARRRPRLLLWDANRRPDEPGPGPTWLAEKINGQTTGARIDGAVSRRVQVLGHGYHERVAGVEMESDHPHAFRIDFALPRGTL